MKGNACRRKSPRPHSVQTRDSRYKIDSYKRGRSLPFESKFQKYAEIVRIDTIPYAKDSIKKLQDEFENAKQDVKKRRIIWVANRASNIAQIGSGNKNYSEEERREMAQISRMYRELQRRLSVAYKREKR